MNCPVGKLLRRDTLLFCCFFDFLTMLIGASQEVNIVSADPFVPGHDIGGDRCVCMSDMGYIIDIIYGSRNIVMFVHVFLVCLLRCEK